MPGRHRPLFARPAGGRAAGALSSVRVPMAERVTVGWMAGDEPRARVWRQWVVACTLGELIGFGLLPAAAGLMAYTLTTEVAPVPRALILYVVSIVGGLGEGAVLAGFQLTVLKKVMPAIDGRRWVVYTATAAAVAWGAGMLAPTLDDIVGLPVAAQVAVWLFAAVVIVPSIGFAQSLVLRSLVEQPHRWTLANAFGWLVGLQWTFVLPMMLPDDAPPLYFGVAMVVGGVLMGLTVGMVTGRALITLERK